MDIDKELKEAESLVRKLRDEKRKQQAQNIINSFPNGNCTNCLHSIITHDYDIHTECDRGQCMVCRKDQICEEYIQCSVPEKRKFIRDIYYRNSLTPEELNKFNLDDLEKLYKILSKYIEDRF